MVKNTLLCQPVYYKYHRQHQLWNDPIQHNEYFKWRDFFCNGSEYALLPTEGNNNIFALISWSHEEV